MGKNKPQSPIEEIFYNRLNSILSLLSDMKIKATPQVQIGKYRVDFLITGVEPPIVVECDGHEFHERTKEQANRDHRRDQDLQDLGYRVYRFTGSEIYRNPHKCAIRVLYTQMGKYLSSKGIGGVHALP